MVKIFLDGPSLEDIEKYDSTVAGYTTNPSLLKKLGISDYKDYALRVLSKTDKPVSFEVLADEMEEMIIQAIELDSWGKNVFVKIPVTDTKGRTTFPVIKTLVKSGIKLNVTAVMTIKQVGEMTLALEGAKPAYLSIFAGRIADTGRDPLTTMIKALYLLKGSGVELIWASPREAYNYYQADQIGCHVITCSKDIIEKVVNLRGKDLTEYSLDTVKQFFTDAKGLNIN
jgi:transaldolase